MYVPGRIRLLSHDQREMLVSHVCGPQAIRVRPGREGTNERRTVAALKKLGLVCEGRSCDVRPKTTHLTDLGRHAAADVLAHYAEQLVRAGRLDDVRWLKLKPRDLAEMRLTTTPTSALTKS